MNRKQNWSRSEGIVSCQCLKLPVATEINIHPLLERVKHSVRRSGDVRRQTGPERATFTPNVPELCSVFLFMMSCMVEMGNGSLLSLLGAWSKSTTGQLSLGRLRLNARFSARVLGGGSPSQIREQAVVMPQKEGSSECEDPSELPSDGESLNIGWSNLFVRGVGFVVTGTPLHTTPPLHSSAAAWKEGFRVSTLSMGFILRRLLFLLAEQRLCVSSACSISGPSVVANWNDSEFMSGYDALLFKPVSSQEDNCLSGQQKV